jgi:hypothetical protein
MLELVPLADLSPEEVAQHKEKILSDVTAENPTLYLKRGLFADLLVHYQSVLTAQRQRNVQDYLNARSLQAITENPALAAEGIVDDILSNFRVTRKLGAKAVGNVVIVVSSSVTVTIAQGSVFESNGQRFIAPTVYVASIDAVPGAGSGARPLAATGDGRWSFTISVEAEEEGAATVRKDSLVLPLVAPPNFVTSYAATDFASGFLPQTNDELLSILQTGPAAKAPSNRTNMQAMLIAVDEFARVGAMSIIGFGDAEMLRDAHWIMPVSGGGRCDWYIRTQEALFRASLTKTATLVEKATDNRGIWQVALDRNDAPGFYEVINIRPAGSLVFAGGYAVVLDERGLDLSGDGFIPDIATVAEGAYSRFQTAVIRFKDTDVAVADLAIGATASYSFEVREMPLIGAIQDFVSERDTRSYGADCLVKAPVPCFVSLGMTIYRRSGDIDPDVAAIKEALCTEVNNTPFVGQIYASRLYDIIHGHLHNDQTVSALDLLGRLRYPDGEIVILRDTEKIVVPDDAARMVSFRTVQFFLSPEDVAISVVASVPTAL